MEEGVHLETGALWSFEMQVREDKLGLRKATSAPEVGLAGPDTRRAEASARDIGRQICLCSLLLHQPAISHHFSRVVLTET